MKTPLALFCLAGVLSAANPASAAPPPAKPAPATAAKETSPVTYRRFTVIEQDGKVAKTEPVPDQKAPRWATDVSQATYKWPPCPPETPFFQGPTPYVLPPMDGPDEPFYPHNHQPDITWLPNGDLLAIWYSTREESGPELTVLAARLRAGTGQWDPSSEFFKAENRNMHGNSIYYDGEGTVHHINGMGRAGATGWGYLALLHRTSRDNGVTWSPARPISTGAEYANRHQVIAGVKRTRNGAFIQLCDATPGGQGNTALHISRDGGKTWAESGGDIRGIHAAVIELKDGKLLGLGRDQAIDGKMPMSISADGGKTWTYSASEFPPISGGQRIVLLRLREGPLLLISFTNYGRRDPKAGLPFLNANGKEFTGVGMFAAISKDEGKTWPVRKLITPGSGRFDGGAHTKEFEATPTQAEHAGYLAATQSPDNVIHLISSRLHYRFNLKWIETPPPSIP